jgi:hypothetical protein
MRARQCKKNDDVKGLATSPGTSCGKPALILTGPFLHCVYQNLVVPKCPRIERIIAIGFMSIS